MNKIILLTMLFSFELAAICQKGYSEGYIITPCHDTLHGLVKDRKQGFNTRYYKRIRFIDQEGKRKRYTPYKHAATATSGQSSRTSSTMPR